MFAISATPPARTISSCSNGVEYTSPAPSLHQLSRPAEPAASLLGWSGRLRRIQLWLRDTYGAAFGQNEMARRSRIQASGNE